MLRYLLLASILCLPAPAFADTPSTQDTAEGLADMLEEYVVYWSQRCHGELAAKIVERQAELAMDQFEFGVSQVVTTTHGEMFIIYVNMEPYFVAAAYAVDGELQERVVTVK